MWLSGYSKSARLAFFITCLRRPGSEVRQKNHRLTVASPRSAGGNEGGADGDIHLKNPMGPPSSGNSASTLATRRLSTIIGLHSEIDAVTSDNDS
jgi:hypothetical protein